MKWRPKAVCAWLLGAWLGASVFMILVAIRNFRMAEALIASPSPGMAERLSRYGRNELYLILRHQASELNQLYFASFELAELGLAAFVLSLAFTRLRHVRMLLPIVVLLLAILSIQHFYLTPGITAYGKSSDFRMPDVASTGYAGFRRLHGTYSTLELIKLALLLAASVRLWFEKGERTA